MYWVCGQIELDYKNLIYRRFWLNQILNLKLCQMRLLRVFLFIVLVGESSIIILVSLSQTACFVKLPSQLSRETWWAVELATSENKSPNVLARVKLYPNSYVIQLKDNGFGSY